MRFTRWDQVLSSGETDEVLSFYALSLCDEISESQALTRENLRECIARADYRSLVDYNLDYEGVSVPDAIVIRQVLALFSKREDLDVGYDKARTAITGFVKSEELCRETDHIFRLWAAGKFQFNPRTEGALHSAQRLIARVLGDVPPPSEVKFRFGPGATTATPKRKASARRKLSEANCCSEALADSALLKSLLGDHPHWPVRSGYSLDKDGELWDHLTIEIHRSRMGFVPKNAKTYRITVTEPGLNVFVQLGYGDYIADRLRRFGIDTRDQTRNQKFAREGSISGRFATIDLTSASDCVARELVAHLLPIDWFLLLDEIRSLEVQFGKTPEWFRLSKFSTMGNGFTFQLETLVFWALACSVVEPEDLSQVCTYGDDIIVPTYAYESLISVLRDVGFIPNEAKSFSKGPFRESCGTDWLRGIDIRPVYVTDRLSGQSLFTLHNELVRRNRASLAIPLLAFIDPTIQLWGPDGYGDGHLIGDFEPRPHRRGYSSTNPRVCQGWGGYTFETFRYEGCRDKTQFATDYIYPLYTVYTGEHLGVPQDDLFRLKRRDAKFAAICRDAGLIRQYLPGTFKGFLKSVNMQEPLWSEHDTQKRKDGSLAHHLVVTVPGTRGCKRIKIYTLN